MARHGYRERTSWQIDRDVYIQPDGPTSIKGLADPGHPCPALGLGWRAGGADAAGHQRKLQIANLEWPGIRLPKPLLAGKTTHLARHLM